MKAGVAKRRNVDPDRADAKAPLNARINATLQVQQTPLLRAQTAGTLFDMPSSPQDIIQAISHVQLDDESMVNGSIWRLHTAVARDLLEDDSRFLQVFVAPDGSLREAMMCTRLVSFTPSPEEVGIYRGDDGQGLGGQVYDLSREQLTAIGLDDAQLRAVLGDEPGLSFTRDVQPDDEFVAPFQAEETRIDDAQGQRGAKSEIWFMPYVRSLQNGAPEFLLIQMTHQTEQDGDASREVLAVQLWIGLPIEAERIQIL